MGKQNRVIAQKTKVKQQQNTKKPKAVKTNLKRLNEHVRDKVEKIDKLYQKNENQTKKQEQTETTKQDQQNKKSIQKYLERNVSHLPALKSKQRGLHVKQFCHTDLKEFQEIDNHHQSFSNL